MGKAFDGEITALSRYGQLEHIRWKNGVIASREGTSPEYGQSAKSIVFETLFDPQINGFAGVDFQQYNLSVEQLLHSVHALRRHGCTQILLTLITDEWPRLMKRLAQLKKMRDAHPELRECFAGWHIEGPFLSAEPGFRGAHDPVLMIDPQASHIDELRAITGDDPVMLTLAPERRGSVQAIERAAQSGMTISLGHTDASDADFANAVAAGASAFTHLGNGCPRSLDRQDNILWRALNCEALVKGIIPDGIHVTPNLFRLFHAALRSDLPIGGAYYTTDAMAAAGAPPGEFTIGKVKVQVGADGVVRLPGQPYFAGSALTPLDGLLRAARMMRYDILSQVPYFTYRSRDLIKLRNGLHEGEPASFCVLNLSDDGIPETGTLYLRGEPTPLLINPTH